ncbi:MAG: 5-(carboxyamino)imidazole ribonucleotide mutase [Actinobacteria bacterium]|nr:5-(carboxyamino)imidazole ribonucleotide mutase [Actinomycetota bacterium]
MTQAQVGIVMGSKTDMPVMEKAAKLLEEFGVEHTIDVMSAHRQPRTVSEWASSAAENGYRVLIAGAGRAAHLPGVVAAHTTLPVIGVPCLSDHLGGADALYSIVQMPSGVPVATVGIDNAKNAALLAIQILALSDDELASKLADHKAEQAGEGPASDRKLGFQVD